jgi:endoglucanase
MRKPTLLFFVIFFYITSCAQSRLKIVSIIPSENTGQDYSSWLSDDLSNLVPNCWNSTNFKYVDVTLKLEKRSSISKLSLYDYEGIFTDNPVSIYALTNNGNNSQKTLIGIFTGEKYMEFVNLIPDTPIIADAIIIHKYCNNIPQKVQVFGTTDIGNGKPDSTSLPHAIISFDLPNKTEGDSPFQLIAKSSNNQTPVTFTSSNPAVVSVDIFNGIWMAAIVKAGTAIITASQAAGSSFLAADDVAKTIIVHPAGSSGIVNGKIPIDPKRWFQLTNASNGLGGLFDGRTDGEVNTGWGKILDNYDSYYPVLDGEEIDISSIRLYDGSGSNTAQPMTISVINSQGQRISVATFTGAEYNTWVGPQNIPNQFNLQTNFTNIKYIVINSWNFFPTEIEFYGNYSPGNNLVLTPSNKKSFPLRQMFGVNGFEWNFEAPSNPGRIDNEYFKAAKTFTGFRHYMDWEKLESSQGSYSFNPTQSGGWNYDDLYDSCQSAGIEVLACLKTLPGWMLSTYPPDQRDPENVPLKYGKDFTDPMSYIEQAKVAFQYAARYGSNKNVNPSLLSVNSQPRWYGDHVNAVKIGLGTIRYIECDNERDKWWKGRKAYQTAYEYAANLSAFYDGNKNTMGPGVGVKNADPNMKVVMAGTALATTDYLKGMIDWCRQHRGFNADGTVNLCWDVINYHLYSTDSKTSQNGNATRGAAPEISGAAEVAADFILTAHQYANDMPVWVTELGYDINQGSPFKAIPIGNKTALQTQADWILRSSLLYARLGIERIFFYELYDDNIYNNQQFNSSGLINADKSRKPAADYIYQANKLFGQYVYQQTINQNPVVDMYRLDDNVMYAVVVPDERGRTTQYTLDLGNAVSAKLYVPQVGSDNMTMQTVPVVNGKLNITATETPMFVVPAGNELGNSKLANESDKTKSQINVPIVEQNLELQNTIEIFPNPASEFINITINTKSSENVSVKMVEAASGRIFENVQFSKPPGYISKTIDVSFLPIGYYIIEIKQGNSKVIKKILKTYAGNISK